MKKDIPVPRARKLHSLAAELAYDRVLRKVFSEVFHGIKGNVTGPRCGKLCELCLSVNHQDTDHTDGGFLDAADAAIDGACYSASEGPSQCRPLRSHDTDPSQNGKKLTLILLMLFKKEIPGF